MQDVMQDVMPAAALSTQAILIRYVLFAIIAGLANIGLQDIVTRLVPAAPIMLSILAGTGAGFIVKYLLDKYLVFRDRYQSHAAEVKKVFLYGLSGIGTTAIFWGVELAFFHIFGTRPAKYGGAVLGLAIGNWVKYRLDRRFVFPGGRS